MNVTFDPTIKLSDILTSLSFILAVLALVFSRQKDRTTARQAQVSEARTVLATSLRKLERWRDVAASVFDDMQPSLVQTTEIWAKNGDVAAARDYLWTEVNNILAGIARTIAREQIKVAHVELYRISHDLPNHYREALTALTQLSTRSMGRLMLETQAVVLSFTKAAPPWVTAEMGNALREAVAPLKVEFLEQVEQTLGPLRERILHSLEKSEADTWTDIRNRAL